MRTEGAVGSADLMTVWLASGGAIEALAEGDGCAVRSRQMAVAGEDDGLQAAYRTASAAYCRVEDGLQAGPTSYFCADDSLWAGNFSRNPLTCLDDGLRAATNTALASCVDGGGLAAGRPSLSYPCGGPAFQASQPTRNWCVDDGLQAGSVPFGLPSLDDGLQVFRLTTGLHAC